LAMLVPSLYAIPADRLYPAVLTAGCAIVP
jgi:hypothetical protein